MQPQGEFKQKLTGRFPGRKIRESTMDLEFGFTLDG
jgi:hypothetical protein